MAKRASREWSVEEYEEWEKAEKRFQAVGKAADEVGGPRLSMVPVPDQGEAWPTDLLPPSVPPEGGKPAVPLPFDGLPLEDSRKRLAGWSADRQRLFLTIVAETGQVHLAASAARLSVRSAQALRVRSPAFNEGWRMAEQLATGRLAPIAFDRAINGRIEQVYHEGQLIAERRIPSDKLLMWLLARLDPKRRPCRGNSAAMPIRRPRRPPGSRASSTDLKTRRPKAARRDGTTNIREHSLVDAGPAVAEASSQRGGSRCPGN